MKNLQKANAKYFSNFSVRKLYDKFARRKGKKKITTKYKYDMKRMLKKSIL